MSQVWGHFWEIPESQWGRRVFDLPCLWGKEAWEDSLRFFFFQRIGIILFLWFFGRLDQIQLRLKAAGGQPVKGNCFLDDWLYIWWIRSTSLNRGDFNKWRKSTMAPKFINHYLKFGPLLIFLDLFYFICNILYPGIPMDKFWTWLCWMTYPIDTSTFCRKMYKPILTRAEPRTGESYLNVMVPWKQFYSITSWNKPPINKNYIYGRIPS